MPNVRPIKPLNWQQPTAAPVLRRDHPLFAGLFVAHVGGVNVELVSGRAMTSNGGITTRATAGGIATFSDGSDDFLGVDIPAQALTQWTMLALVQGNGHGTDDRAFFIGSSSATAPYIGIGTGASNANKMRCVWVNNTGGFPTSVDTTADVFNLGRPCAAALTVRDDGVGGVRAYGYVDGVQDGVSASLVPPDATVNRVGVGALYRSSGAVTHFPGAVLLGLAWNRPLSDAEVRDISVNPWQLFEPRRIWVPVSAGGSGPIELEVGRADEADASLGLAAAKSAAIGQAVEASASLALSASKDLAVGQAAEAGQALAPTLTKLLGAAVAAEAVAAFALSAGSAIGVGLAAEADEAHAPSLTKRLGLGRTDEVDAAFALDTVAGGQIGRADEAEVALAPTLTKTLGAGRAEEADVAQALGIGAGFEVGRSDEIDVALAPLLVKRMAVGQATEADAALVPDETYYPPTFVAHLPTERRIAVLPVETRIAVLPAEQRTARIT